MIKEMDEPGELLDLVNDRDEPIDTLQRQDILSLEESRKGFVRAVGVFFAEQQLRTLDTHTRGA